MLRAVQKSTRSTIVVAPKITAYNGARANVTVRKVSSGQGVERILPLQAQTIDNIQVVKHAHVLRAKLYFLRRRVGKQARLKTKLRK